MVYGIYNQEIGENEKSIPAERAAIDKLIPARNLKDLLFLERGDLVVLASYKTVAADKYNFIEFCATMRESGIEFICAEIDTRDLTMRFLIDMMIKAWDLLESKFGNGI